MAVDEQEPLLSPGSSKQEPLRPPIPNESEFTKTEGEMGSLMFAAMLAGIFLSMASESFVASIHEDIASSFDALHLGAWLITAYSMGYTMMLPLYGSLIDLYGGKNTLVFSYATFGLGCVITGCATSMPGVIAGRLVTSLGGAGMVDIVSILLNKTVSLSRVAILRSYLFVALTLGLSCGSPLGGILADTIGWRWSFLIQAPVALVCLAITATKLASDAPNNTSPSQANWISQIFDFDIWGYLFLIIGLGTGLLMLHSMGDLGNRDFPLKAKLGTVCIVSMVLFLVTELRTKKKPVVPLEEMWKNGTGLTCLAQIPMSVCQFATVSNVTSYLIYTKNATTTVASVPLIFYAVGAMIGALASGYSIQYMKGYKAPSIACCLLLAISFTLILVRWLSAPFFWEFSYTALVGIGITALISIQYIVISSRAAESPTSIITSYYLAQQIGGIIGTASSNGLFYTLFRRQLQERLGKGKEAEKIIGRLLQNSRYSSLLPGAIRAQVRSAFLESFKVIPALCLGSIAILIIMILIPKDIETEEK